MNREQQLEIKLANKTKELNDLKESLKAAELMIEAQAKRIEELEANK